MSKQASFLLIGAYGRSRFRETVLGGATRSLLSTSQIPLLLAH
jgi:nucleotide-binding universal stress UspA family protein